MSDGYEKALEALLKEHNQLRMALACAQEERTHYELVANSLKEENAKLENKIKELENKKQRLTAENEILLTSLKRAITDSKQRTNLKD